jgi:predicted Zn finger-like uncharacterized protein
VQAGRASPRLLGNSPPGVVAWVATWIRATPMEVRCNRCGTEYEFDDALIGSLGTHVECSDCGHRFKVYPGAGDLGGSWRVATVDGRELVFVELRELQRAVASGQVGRQDVLSRGRAVPRALGDFPEFEGVFPEVAGEDHRPSTLTGIAPPAGSREERVAAVGATRSPLGFGQRPSRAPAVVATAPATIVSDQPSALLHTLPLSEPRMLAQIPASVAVAAPPQTPEVGKPASPQQGASPAAAFHPKETLRSSSVELENGELQPRGDRGSVPVVASDSAEQVPVPAASAADSAWLRTLQSDPAAAPVGPASRQSADLSAVPLPARERAVTRTLGSAAPPPSASAVVATPSVAELSRTLASDQGLPVASASSVEAGVAATSQPLPIQAAVASAPSLPARGGVSRGPAPGHRSRRPRPVNGTLQWLGWTAVGGGLGAVVLTAVALVPRWFGSPPAPAVRAVSTAQVAALDEAQLQELLLAGRYDDLNALLVRRGRQPDSARWQLLAALEPAELDWWRLAWLSDGALAEAERAFNRKLGRVEQALADAGNAAPEGLRLRLALLEGGAPTPSDALPEVERDYLEAARLRGQQQIPGQLLTRLARHASRCTGPTPMKLAWLALTAQSGNLELARGELKLLQEGPAASEVLAAMGTYLDGRQALVESQAAVATATGTGLAVAPQGAVPPASTGHHLAQQDDDSVIVGGFRSKLDRGRKLQATGDQAGAEALYREVLAEQPGNVEALTGLADAALARGDRSAAGTRYAQALDASPYYLPALMGRADVLWANGDQAEAAKLYRTVVDRLGPSSSWGRRAAERIGTTTVGGSERVVGGTASATATDNSGSATTETRQ